MARGNRRAPIYYCDGDRYTWLDILARTCERFNLVVYAYCQMTDHYHLMVETPDGNLAQGIHQLNGIYAQYVNRRHALVGHLFQGRYKAILVQKESYLLELSRYIVLNPVRAGMTESAEAWYWSSYAATAGEARPATWLDTEWLLAQFGPNRASSIPAYKDFVRAGAGMPDPLQSSSDLLVLGDESFKERYLVNSIWQNHSKPARSQRRPLSKPLSEYALDFSRDEAMARAYWSTAFTMQEIARHFGFSARTVSRAVERFKPGTHERIAADERLSDRTTLPRSFNADMAASHQHPTDPQP
jgi:REP element-mobilizing transposase RayT